MAFNLNSLLNRTPAKTKLALVVIAAISVVGTAVYFSQSEQGVKEVWQRKKDTVTNVLTNADGRQKSIETISGQVKRLNKQTAEQERAITNIRSTMDSEKKSAKISTLSNKMEELDRQMSRLRETQRQLDERLEEMARKGVVPNDSNVGRQPAAAPAAQSGQGEFPDEGNGVIGNPFDPAAGSNRPNAQNTRDYAGPRDVIDDPNKRKLRGEMAKAGNSSRGARAGASIGPRKLQVVSEPVPVDKNKDKPRDLPVDKEAAYIPPGSILTGILITGGDFPTASAGQGNPLPLLMRLNKTAILPNRYSSDVRECFLLASGHGELASARAKLRGETISCIRNDGVILQSSFSGYVVGEDGKEGIKGRLVSKQGQMIARTLMAGFLGGMADAFDYDPVEVLSTTSTGRVQYQKNFSGDAAKGGIAKGFSNAFDKVADFYMKLADQMFPVVEINAGRQVELIAIGGSRLRPVDTTAVRVVTPKTPETGKLARRMK